MTTESPPAEAKPRRRRFTISLRTLMILVLIVGGGIGWKASRASKQRKALAALKQLGAYVLFDYQYSNGQEIPNGKPWAPEWLRKQIGDEYFRNITAVFYMSDESKQKIKDSDIACIDGLDCLERLDLITSESRLQEPEGPNLTDASLAYLERLPRLRILGLMGTRVSDTGLLRLSRMDGLEEIDLNETDTTIAGLAHLQSLKNLRRLGLNSACSGDEGLAEVITLTNLQGLTLNGPCKLTEAGLDLLQRLPHLQELELSYVSLSNSKLPHLKRLANLRKLKITESMAVEDGESYITDQGLASIGDLSELESLKLVFFSSLVGNHATDAGLEHLGRLTKLREFEIDHNSISDSGLAFLKQLNQLRKLTLKCRKITDNGLASIEDLTMKWTPKSRPQNPIS